MTFRQRLSVTGLGEKVRPPRKDTGGVLIAKNAISAKKKL
jgi:hypothetical protein